MPQYVKKPIPIHAQQIQLGVPLEQWLIPYHSSGEIWRTLGGTTQWSMNTKHGVVHATPGDWILQAVDGEIYPCSDELFRATYDEAPVQ